METVLMAVVIPTAPNPSLYATMPFWEDSEIRFDIPFSQMKLRSGEKLIDKLDSVEDTKGNGGDKGRLVVTNLRILWHSLSSPRVSLSIGLNTIISATTKNVISKLRGPVEALYLLTKTANNKYEFIFTNLMPGTTRLFTSVTGVHRAYVSSKMYRELKLRGAIMKNKQLQLLPLEQIVTTENGVWNLSSDQGNLGSFIITNVRVVWFAEMNEHFNVSLPYLQISLVKIRESKFGVALVIESVESSGGYVMGFKIDPQERLKAIHREILSLHTVYSKCPILGVEYTVGNEPILSEDPPTVPEVEKDLDVTSSVISRTVNVYIADDDINPAARPPVYCSDLGLAVEELKEGFTMQDLWEVLPSN
ncbi:Bardet-Biedl syndrome 5 protein [Polyplax serrata]|uniref:Bardet-Biedl syndrome 5 protein n=1 Tax=Polyplax serrata TaxID=468196 RepID=A0AAN8P0E1_POLSC